MVADCENALNKAPRATIASVARRFAVLGRLSDRLVESFAKDSENSKGRGLFVNFFFARSHFSVQNLSPPQCFLSDFDETCFLPGPRH